MIYLELISKGVFILIGAVVIAIIGIFLMVRPVCNSLVALALMDVIKPKAKAFFSLCSLSLTPTVMYLMWNY